MFFGIREIDEFYENHKDERVRIIGRRIKEYRSKLARLTEAYVKLEEEMDRKGEAHDV